MHLAFAECTQLLDDPIAQFDVAAAQLRQQGPDTALVSRESVAQLTEIGFHQCDEGFPRSQITQHIELWRTNVPDQLECRVLLPSLKDAPQRTSKHTILVSHH
jgi:hypothetical protein